LKLLQLNCLTMFVFRYQAIFKIFFKKYIDLLWGTTLNVNTRKGSFFKTGFFSYIRQTPIYIFSRFA
jgi:hypothetical protein